MKFVKQIYKRIDIGENYIFILFIVALILSVILLAKAATVGINENDGLSAPKICELHTVDKVQLTSSDGTIEDVLLPIYKSSNYLYSYKFMVPKDIHSIEQSVAVNPYYSSFVIRYDNEIIYEQKPLDTMLSSSITPLVNIISIPNRLVGKQLEIEFKYTLSDDKKLWIPSLLIGTKNQILAHYFQEEWIKIISALVLFTTAVLVSIVGLFLIKIGQDAKNLFIVVLFAVMMALYSISQSSLIVYYIDNPTLSYCIAYITFMLIPLPLFLLFLNVCYENNYSDNDWIVKSFKIFIVIIFMNFITQWILVLTGISEFVLMEKIDLAILALSVVYIIISLFIMKNIENKKYLVMSILPLLSLLVLSIIIYYSMASVPMLLFIILAVVFFMITQFILTIKKYIMDYNLSIEDNFYGKLAYLDILTELPNRHDFEKDVDNIINKNIVFDNIYLIMLDMNNLKKINDNYGHKFGDAYLKETGKVFNQLKNQHKDIKIYRYGGDEFIIFAYNKQLKELNQLINDINSMANVHIIPKCDYGLEFAVGYSVCDNQSLFDIVAMKDEADINMYEDKYRKKEAKR